MLIKLVPLSIQMVNAKKRSASALRAWRYRKRKREVLEASLMAEASWTDTEDDSTEDEAEDRLDSGYLHQYMADLIALRARANIPYAAMERIILYYYDRKLYDQPV